MNKKEYLNSVYKLHESIEADRFEISKIQNQMYGITGINYAKEPVMGGGLPSSNMEEGLIRLEEVKNRLSRKMIRYEAIRAKLIKEINLMKHTKERYVLIQRYLCFNDWKTILFSMKDMDVHSLDAVFAIHRRAKNHFRTLEQISVD